MMKKLNGYMVIPYCMETVKDKNEDGLCFPIWICPAALSVTKQWKVR